MFWSLNRYRIGKLTGSSYLELLYTGMFMYPKLWVKHLGYSTPVEATLGGKIMLKLDCENVQQHHEQYPLLLGPYPTLKAISKEKPIWHTNFHFET